MIRTAALIATAAAPLALALGLSTGTAAADSYTGKPGHALVSTAQCNHDDKDVVIRFDAPTVYAQPGFLPGENQQIRYRTVVGDLKTGDIVAVTEYKQDFAELDKPAKLADTGELRLTRTTDRNQFVAIQQVEWLAPNQQTAVATADLYATAYHIKDGRKDLGTFKICQ